MFNVTAVFKRWGSKGGDVKVQREWNTIVELIFYFVSTRETEY